MLRLCKSGIKRFLQSGFLLLGIVSSAWAAEGFDDDFDEKPWAEMEVQLPAFPDRSNLIPFEVGAVRDTKFWIDGNSLSVGADGVIRYALVIESSAGAENISYEGIRCATREKRLYAFGRSDKTWSKARDNQWKPIRGSSNNHHVELFSNYFCVPGAPSLGSAEDARRALRSGR
ncbi:CNP1-like family protein [Propionivibrio soli]|uniref:CNP1-like family protein n=1 Tax=Propionivibrio soli TaxID=2976531 RepID=UPI0021E894CF|nr:CNP1-like family protein [Propionivibrio soli]